MALSPTGGRQTKIRHPAAGEKHIRAFGSSEGTGNVRLTGRTDATKRPAPGAEEKGQAYFGCSFSAAELMQ
jgi:hypothetical protein